MLIAERFHVPTVNGYSGNMPEGWNMLEPRDPAYKANAMAWLARKGYSGSVCELDIPSRQWRYLRAYDCAQVETKAPLELNHAGAHFEIPATCLSSLNGSIVDGARIAEAGITPAGMLAFGPYLPLPQGKYTVTLHVKAAHDKSGPAGLWDFGYFCCGSAPNIMLANGSITADTKEIPVTLLVPPERVARGFEFRVKYLGGGRLVVERLSIERQQ
jgi:hypothetical protein